MISVNLSTGENVAGVEVEVNRDHAAFFRELATSYTFIVDGYKKSDAPDGVRRF
ncbi:hypothetical protein [Rubritalea marina]|uniref:hypothetical protein n=1 Tax=Rubritalea marina TaxID=361055 RepID=UPI00037C5028|nr:hypothetical protein [Rubritalea marina]